MNRRTFITTTAGAVSGFFLPGPRSLSAQNRRKRIAALSTTYHVRSHSDNFITRFLEGWWINDTYHEPPCDVASLFVEQEHDADIGNRLARSWGIRKVPTIREALTLGGDKLDVDGVLLIGEHGNYPTNVKNQKLYPRYRFMDQVVSVFKHSRTKSSASSSIPGARCPSSTTNISPTTGSSPNRCTTGRANSTSQ